MPKEQKRCSLTREKIKRETFCMLLCFVIRNRLFYKFVFRKKYVLSNRNLDPRLSVSFAYKEGREERPVIEADPIVFYLILSYVIPGHHRQ